MYKGKGSCDVKRGNENYCMNKNIKFNSETGYGLRSMLLRKYYANKYIIIGVFKICEIIWIE